MVPGAAEADAAVALAAAAAAAVPAPRRQSSALDNAEPAGWLGRLQRVGRRPASAGSARDEGDD